MNFRIVLTTTALMFSLFFGLFFFHKPKCKRGHTELVHHPAWIQYITTSVKPLIMTPIFHPAYDANEFICDEWCGKHDPAPECK